MRVWGGGADIKMKRRGKTNEWAWAESFPDEQTIIHDQKYQIFCAHDVNHYKRMAISKLIKSGLDLLTHRNIDMDPHYSDLFPGL